MADWRQVTSAEERATQFEAMSGIGLSLPAYCTVTRPASAVILIVMRFFAVANSGVS